MDSSSTAQQKAAVSFQRFLVDLAAALDDQGIRREEILQVDEETTEEMSDVRPMTGADLLGRRRQ